MMTTSNGNIFRATGHLCGEFTGPGDFPAQRPVTRSFDVFFDLRPNKRLSKQPWGWWFETPSWSLWRQCNGSNTLRRNCIQPPVIVKLSFARRNIKIGLLTDVELAISIVTNDRSETVSSNECYQRNSYDLYISLMLVFNHVLGVVVRIRRHLCPEWK